jgi:hypothetical protein
MNMTNVGVVPHQRLLVIQCHHSKTGILNLHLRQSFILPCISVAVHRQEIPSAMALRTMGNLANLANFHTLANALITPLINHTTQVRHECQGGVGHNIDPDYLHRLGRTGMIIDRLTYPHDLRCPWGEGWVVM